MKIASLLVILLITSFTSSFAQQRMNPGGMTYIYNPKPNSILYHDTLYRGAKQFGQLFYRTGDVELMRYYKKHQTNKTVGQAISVLGTAFTVIGITTLTPSSNVSKGASWAMIGGGFAATLAGGYLAFTGQRNLQMAVEVFNSKYSRGRAGIGVGNRQAGLVYAF